MEDNLLCSLSGPRWQQNNKHVTQWTQQHNRTDTLKPSACVISCWFSVTSQLLQKLLAPLVSQFSHQAPLSSGNSAPWLSTCVFLQAASIINMLTRPRRSSQRLQASKHLQLFRTHFSITTMNPCWPKLRLPAATWAAETNSLPERWFFFFYTNSVTIWERHLLAG